MAVAGYERLEEEVLDLPKEDRSRLASRLLESLEEELSPEWQEELQRRMTAFDEGRTKMIPAEDLWKEANQRFGTSF